MTELIKEFADDWEWEIKDTDCEGSKAAFLFGLGCGLSVNIPYNGHDGDLIEKLNHYHLSEQEKTDLGKILDREQEESRAGIGDYTPDIEDITVDEYAEIIESDLHGMGDDLSLMLSYIYGDVPKRGKVFLDFPSAEECESIIYEKDAPRWLMYISGKM